MNNEEAKKLLSEQEYYPVKTKLFKHKKTGDIQSRISIFELSQYEEVKQ